MVLIFICLLLIIHASIQLNLMMATSHLFLFFFFLAECFVIFSMVFIRMIMILFVHRLSIRFFFIYLFIYPISICNLQHTFFNFQIPIFSYLTFFFEYYLILVIKLQNFLYLLPNDFNLFVVKIVCIFKCWSNNYNIILYLFLYSTLFIDYECYY